MAELLKKAFGGSTTGGTDVWQPQQGYLEDMWGQAQNTFQQGTGTEFSRQFQQPTLDAYNQIVSQQNPQGLMDIASGQQQNQALGGAIDAGLGKISRNLNRNIMPSINSGAVASGTSGGSRQAIAQALSASDANQQSTDFVNQMLSGNYQSGLANQLGAYNQMNQNDMTKANVMGMSPALQNLGLNTDYGNLDRYSNVIGAPIMQNQGGETYGGMFNKMNIV